MQTVDLLGLFKAAISGDQTSYAKFLEVSAKILRSFVAKRIARNDVEDVVQEILISIHKSRHSFDAKRPIMPWIFSIARFRIADHLRKTYASINFADVDFDELCEVLPDVTTSNENHEYVNDLLKNVEPLKKNILLMLYVEGYSVKEVAGSLNMSESAVKVAAHRVIKKIRKEWKPMS